MLDAEKSVGGLVGGIALIAANAELPVSIVGEQKPEATFCSLLLQNLKGTF